MAHKAPTPHSVGVFSSEEIVGDGLYKLVFLRSLRAAFPAARITWMTTRGSVFAHSLQPATRDLLDVVVERCGIGEAVTELLRPAPRLGPFDLLLDTQALLWRTVSAWRLPHRRFRSAATLRCGLGGARIGPHALDRIFALLETSIGRAVPRDLSPLMLPPALTAAAAAALPGDVPRVAFAPGAGGVHKCWPLDRYIALARHQAIRGRTPVFLLGPAEAVWRARIAAELPETLFPEEHPAFAALVQTGPQPLRAVAVAARCMAGVANDAGPGHMIAASGAPLLSLFGPTRPEKFRPMATRSSVLRAQDFGGEAMDRIPLEAALAALEALLNPSAHRG